jgi:predicted DNA-binding protein YlxM (UPF0122 family)
MAKSKKTDFLSDVELFYIEGNCLKMSLDEIAEKLNVKKETISEIYEKNKRQKELTFQTHSGTTSMTASQSSKDDVDSTNINQKEAFLKRYNKNIHKI